MKKTVINPFLTRGYKSPDFFCDREKETADLIRALQNGRNVTLMSQRRLGKTGLIHNVFYHLKQQGYTCIYMDIYGTLCQEDFVRILVKKIIGSLDSRAETFLNTVATIFRSCRPVLTQDPISGMPAVTVELQPQTTEHTLEEAFEYLKKSDKPCFIAIDEFQQIAKYPEKGLEATLRSYIQFMPNVHFIFSGSKMHLLAEIFSSPARPFYQSTQKMHLEAISETKYYEFAQHHLQLADKHISSEDFTTLYKRFNGVTWYMQMLLNRIYEQEYTEITQEVINQTLAQIIEEESVTYKQQMEIMTLNQAQLLRAIAKEDNVKNITSQAFLTKYKLKAASSVKLALKWLLENELVLQNENSYCVYDKFMALWLQQ